MSHVCHICQKEFNSGPLLGSHIRSHTRKLFKCDLCNKSYGEKVINDHKISCLQKKESSKKVCEKCGSNFESLYARFCSRSCANSRIISEEHKIKTSKSLLGRKFLDSIKTEQDFIENEKKIIKYNDLRKDKFCKYCNKIVNSINGRPTKDWCTPKCNESIAHKKEILSKSLKGKTGGYREKGGRGKGEYYNEIWMDSTWEIILAKRLDDLNIEWERDIKKHKLVYIDELGEKRKYYPDFYLPKLNVYLEVKGYWTKETKFKMFSVKKENPNLKIIVLESIDQINSFDGSI